MTLSELRSNPNYDKIKGSVQIAYFRRRAIGAVVFLMLYFLLIMLPILSLREMVAEHGNEAAWTMCILVMVLVILMVAISGIYPLVIPFAHMDSYTFTEVAMDHPYPGYRGRMCFAVEVMDRRGKRRKRYTRMMFSHAQPNFEEYLNKKALIGYNDETDTVVVIGLAEN